MLNYIEWIDKIIIEKIQKNICQINYKYYFGVYIMFDDFVL